MEWTSTEGQANGNPNVSSQKSISESKIIRIWTHLFAYRKFRLLTISSSVQCRPTSDIELNSYSACACTVGCCADVLATFAASDTCKLQNSIFHLTCRLRKRPLVNSVSQRHTSSINCHEKHRRITPVTLNSSLHHRRRYSNTFCSMTSWTQLLLCNQSQMISCGKSRL